MSVIRITVKWLIGLLRGYVITTTGVTQSPSYQSEGCAVMIYRLFRITLLTHHNVIMTTANGILFVLHPSAWFVRIHVGIAKLCILLEDHNDFKICGMHTQSVAKASFQWVFTANSCGVATF